MKIHYVNDYYRFEDGNYRNENKFFCNDKEIAVEIFTNIRPENFNSMGETTKGFNPLSLLNISSNDHCHFIDKDGDFAIIEILDSEYKNYLNTFYELSHKGMLTKTNTIIINSYEGTTFHEHEESDYVFNFA